MSSKAGAKCSRARGEVKEASKGHSCRALWAKKRTSELIPCDGIESPKDFKQGSNDLKLKVAGLRMVKNPPANAGDVGSRPGPGRSHMPRSN